MRHAPDHPLPAAAYRPGGPDAPTFDPPDPALATPLARASFRDHLALGYGIDLYNRGFDWEAHEVWERSWRVTPEGAEHALLQALIQLAAARLHDGQASLVERAHGHLREARADGAIVCGIDVDELLAQAAAPDAIVWRRRSRELPATFSDMASQPLECQFERRDGFILMTTPGRPTYYSGRMLHLDDPIGLDELPRWRTLARGALASQGPGFHNICWEIEGAGPVLSLPEPVPEKHELGHMEALRATAFASEPPLPDGVTIGRLETDAQWLAAGEMAGDLGVAAFGEAVRPFSAWRYECYRESMALRGGGFVAAFDGDRVVGALGIMRVGDFYRYQDVQTREDYRRRGIATRLLFEAFQLAQEHGPRPAVIVADAGSDANRLYRKLGFEQVSTQYSMQWPYPEA